MSQEMAAVWRKRLDDWDLSLLPPWKLCELHGIKLSQYYYWRKRLARPGFFEDPEPDDEQNGRWLAVEVVEPEPVPTAGGGIKVRVGRLTLEIEPGFHPATLRAVLEALGADPC